MLGKPLAIVSALLVLGGCGSSESDPPDAGPSPVESPSASSAAPTPTETPTGAALCTVLSVDEVGELAGETLRDVHETDIGGLLPACIWGSLDDVGVQAGVVDAGLWARSLPEVVESLKQSGVVDDAANLRKLDEAADLIESGSEIPAAEACELFSDLIELNGVPRGSDTTVNLVPSAEDPQAITAQICRDGAYATVLVARPDLTGSAAEARRVRAAAEEILSRRSR